MGQKAKPPKKMDFLLPWVLTRHLSGWFSFALSTRLLVAVVFLGIFFISTLDKQRNENVCLCGSRQGADIQCSAFWVVCCYNLLVCSFQIVLELFAYHNLAHAQTRHRNKNVRLVSVQRDALNFSKCFIIRSPICLAKARTL